MKELGRPESSESLEGTEVRVSEASLEELMSREDSPSTSGMRCWQGEVEVEDRWGISSPTSRSEGCAPSGILEKSKSRQHGSRRSLHRAGRRVFSCFRHSRINLTVPDLEPSTPPKSGPLLAPRTSVSGANGVTFMHEAIDHRHHVDNDDDLDSEEPTSPVVNCMGQVRPKQKHSKIEAAPREIRDDKDKFRRTKSQAPSRSPVMVSKSKPCNWKQLLRSNSSSISPSNHPCGSEGEPEIDLCRFSSASGSSDPFYRQTAGASGGEKLPDKTCLLMRRNSIGRSNPVQESHDSSDNTVKLLQEQLDARNSRTVEGEQRKTVLAESEPVFRNLPSLKTTRIESPKWFADEPLIDRRQGLFKSSRMDSQTLKSSSTPLSHI